MSPVIAGFAELPVRLAKESLPTECIKPLEVIHREDWFMGTGCDLRRDQNRMGDLFAGDGL